MSRKIYFFLGLKKIIFIGVMFYVRERLFFKKKKFGKQPIENKLYFYKSFPLTNFFF